MKRWVKFILSLAITIGCMWWTLRHQFDPVPVGDLPPGFRDAVDVRWWQVTWASVKSANYLMLVPYLLLLGVIHVCRTVRWGNLLSGIEQVRFKPLNEAAAIGFMMLVVLPFRLGEFARPFLIAQRSTIRRSAAMTSVVLERIIDGIIIAVLLRGLLFFVPGESAELARIEFGANVMFLVFSGGLVFLVLARWQHDRVMALIRATIGRFAPGPTEKVVHILDGFVGALRQLPDRRNLTFFALFTAAYWTMNGVGMWVFANAFDCSTGAQLVCEPLHLTLFQGFVVLSVLIIGLMIPAAPGSAGTFQAFILLGLSVFVPKSVADSSGVAYAYAIWVVQLLQQIGTGLVFLVLSNASFKDITGKLGEEQRASA